MRVLPEFFWRSRRTPFRSRTISSEVWLEGARIDLPRAGRYEGERVVRVCIFRIVRRTGGDEKLGIYNRAKVADGVEQSNL